MKHLAILLFLCSILIVPVHAQEDRFKETFDKETTKKAQGGNARFKNVNVPWQPAELPAWFFSLPTDGVYAIGISDPDMENEKAMEMAMSRGKGLLALMKKTRVRYIKDSYSSNIEEGRGSLYMEKFDTYSKFDTKFKGEAELVDTFFTAYNEALVLLKYKKSRTKEKVNVMGKFLSLEFVYNNRNEYQNEYEIEIDEYVKRDQTGDLYYDLKEVNRKYNYVSKYQGEEFEAPGFYYKYQRPGGEEKPFYINNGIWKEYIKELYKKMQIAAEDGPFSVKNLSDNYASKNEKLIRQTGHLYYSFHVDLIEFKGDTLNLNLSGTILDKR